jgi:putative ABC transport system substrate-binding protein
MDRVLIGSFHIEFKFALRNLKSAILLCAMLFALCFSAEAQQPATVHRIGFLGGSSASAYASFVEAFQQGMRVLGYVEGKSFVIEHRYGDGKLERLPELSSELIRLGVDVIVVSGARAISQVKSVTTTIPVVMTTIEDPVAMGIVDSLARPGGNITGLTNLAPELSGKRLELLKEALPKASRVAVMWPPEATGAVVAFKETEVAARALGVRLQSLEVRSQKDFDNAFRAAKTERAGALIVLQSALTNAHRKPIMDLALKNRLPTMCTQKEYVEAGGLMSYGVDTRDLYRRAAGYVDKILKGTKPADLPVEQAMKFELFINLKTAKQIGLTIPPNLLVRADRVIR